ncbi:MAG: bifunctional nuclease family protein [Brooklawnia sp.]|uniref:bifunctional nuclease family protein n=1 Tax=Brooklawnia sp. TaxID=2699740 RepID=UPI003C774E2A
MIQVELASMAVDSRGQPVVILRPSFPQPQPYVLPIWIGVQEASAIMFALEGVTAARPMSYDLMVRLLDAMDATVQQVAVTRLEEGTFFAEITLVTPAGRRIIDARPSDSIALAMRTESPIYIAEEVLREAGVSESQLAEAPDEEATIEEFTEFLDTVDPDDFRG